jgi:hypothetical protein
VTKWNKFKGICVVTIIHFQIKLKCRDLEFLFYFCFIAVRSHSQIFIVLFQGGLWDKRSVMCRRNVARDYHNKCLQIIVRSIYMYLRMTIEVVEKRLEMSWKLVIQVSFNCIKSTRKCILHKLISSQNFQFKKCIKCFNFHL